MELIQNYAIATPITSKGHNRNDKLFRVIQSFVGKWTPPETVKYQNKRVRLKPRKTFRLTV